MSNKNYVAGAAFERATQKAWERRGYSTIRASGSHGLYDVVAFSCDRKPEMIQCKRCTTEAEAARLMRNFKKVTIPSLYFHQSMAVKVKGSIITISVTV